MMPTDLIVFIGILFAALNVLAKGDTRTWEIKSQGEGDAKDQVYKN